MAPTLPTNHQAPGWGQNLLDWLTIFGSPQFVRSGCYISSGGTSNSGSNLTLNKLALAPFFVPAAVTLIEAAMVVQSAGATSVLRGGIYTDDGNGAPSTLSYEFPATFDCSTTGLKTQVISIALSAGLYWVGGAPQVANAPSVQIPNLYPAAFIVNNGQPAAGTTSARAYSQTGVTGALPASFTFVVSNVTTAVPYIALKVQ